MPESTSQLMIEILQTLRDELRTHRALHEKTVEGIAALNRRQDETNRRLDNIEHRFSEETNTLEMIIRSEMLGSRTHFETQFEHKLEDVIERLHKLEVA
jgi:hypothetical protein